MARRARTPLGHQQRRQQIKAGSVARTTRRRDPTDALAVPPRTARMHPTPVARSPRCSPFYATARHHLSGEGQQLYKEANRREHEHCTLTITLRSPNS